MMKTVLRFIVLLLACAPLAMGQEVDSSTARVSRIELIGIRQHQDCGEGQPEYAEEIISTPAGSQLEAVYSPSDSESSDARLSVRSNIAGARVFDDSMFLGVTPLDSVSIKPGAHILRYVSFSVSWFSTPVVETVHVHASESLVRTVNFPVLNSLNVAPAATASALAKEQSTNNFPIYASTTCAVVTGIVAAYFKIRADNSYDDFRQNGDPGLLDRVHSLDRASGIALAACQASLFLMTYSLLSR